MPRNGSGTYTLPQLPFQPGTTISSTAVNSNFSDIASAITDSVAADGQTTMSGALKLASGSSAAPSLTFSVDQTSGLRHGSTGTVTVVGGAADVATFDGTHIGGTGNLFYYTNGAIVNPVGMVVDFAGSSAPTGWKLCAAQVLAQASYPELFAVCGSTYNTGGEGAGNFRLPDCRGRVSAGQDNMGGSAANRITVAGGNFDGTVLGNTGGAQNHTMLSSEMPAHSHTATVTDTHTHALSGTTGTQSNARGPGPGDALGASGGSSSTGGTNAGSITVSNANTGGGGAFTVLSPVIIFTKIVFAGRP